MWDKKKATLGAPNTVKRISSEHNKDLHSDVDDGDPINIYFKMKLSFLFISFPRIASLWLLLSADTHMCYVQRDTLQDWRRWRCDLSVDKRLGRKTNKRLTTHKIRFHQPWLPCTVASLIESPKENSISGQMSEGEAFYYADETIILSCLTTPKKRSKISIQ